MKSQLFLSLALALCCVAAAGAETVTIELTEGSSALLPEHVIKCRAVAHEKLESQAKSFGVTVDMSTLRITGSDANSMAKYLWWTVDVTNVNGRTDVFPKDRPARLTKMTQQPAFSACF